MKIDRATLIKTRGSTTLKAAYIVELENENERLRERLKRRGARVNDSLYIAGFNNLTVVDEEGEQ